MSESLQGQTITFWLQSRETVRPQRALDRDDPRSAAKPVPVRRNIIVRLIYHPSLVAVCGGLEMRCV
jgi:hypothetical protein